MTYINKTSYWVHPPNASITAWKSIEGGHIHQIFSRYTDHIKDMIDDKKYNKDEVGEAIIKPKENE